MSQTSLLHRVEDSSKLLIRPYRYKYDPEYAAAVARTSLPSAPPGGDIVSRRSFADNAFGEFLRESRPAFQKDISPMVYYAAGPGGQDVPVYHFKPQEKLSSSNSSILYIHGGGMITGSVPALAPLISDMANSTGLDVFAVEYRLASEHPHPALVSDFFGALSWLRDNAADFDLDPARIVVYGESAGGGIAAGLALLARDSGFYPPIAKQVLVFPMLDDRTTTPIPDLIPFATWTYEDNMIAWTALLGEGLPRSEGVSAYAAPARAKSLAGLPPTYIDVGELVIFRDEDMAYAMRLAASDVPLEFHLYPGVPHGWDIIGKDIEVTRRAYANRVRALTSA